MKCFGKDMGESIEIELSCGRKLRRTILFTNTKCHYRLLVVAVVKVHKVEKGCATLRITKCAFLRI